MSSAARGDGHQGRRQCVPLRDQVIERRLAVDLLGGVDIEVDHPHAARRSGRRADHGVGPASPPRANLYLVLRCVLEALRCERLLVERVAGKDRNAHTDITEQGIEFGWDIGLSLRHYMILPPRY
jgi:hypothetical protein